VKCPKCGFEQPDDIYCAQCGIEVTAYARSHSQIKRLALGIGIGLIVLVGIVAFVMFRGEDSPTRVSDPLSIDDASISYSDRTERDVEVPASDSETIKPPEPAPEVQPGPDKAAKPVPPTIVSSTLRYPGAMVSIPIGKIGGNRNDLRLVSIKNGMPEDVIFQIDSGWDLEAHEKVQKNDVILALAVEAGDRDDQSAMSRRAEDVQVAEVKDSRGGKGWFYLYRDSDYRPSTESDLVNFSQTPEKASTETYIATFNSGHSNLLDSLNVGGINLIDRLKIRVSTEEFVADEEVMATEADSFTDGPLLARSHAEGSVLLGEEDFPFIRETAYFHDHFEIKYTFDFPPEGIKDGIVRVYLDLSDEADGLRLVTADQPDGELIDGEGAAGEHRGLWFAIVSGEKALRVTSTGSVSKLVIMDDVSIEDPPESIAGCLGCCGFEFFRLKGKLTVRLMFEILDWKIGDSMPLSHSTLKARLSTLK